MSRLISYEKNDIFSCDENMKSSKQLFNESKLLQQSDFIQIRSEIGIGF